MESSPIGPGLKRALTVHNSVLLRIEPVENDRYARGIKEENLQLHEDGARSEPNEYHLQAAV